MHKLTDGTHACEKTIAGLPADLVEQIANAEKDIDPAKLAFIKKNNVRPGVNEGIDLHDAMREYRGLTGNRYHSKITDK